MNKVFENRDPDQDNNIDLGRLFRLILMQSKLILLIVSIAFILSLFLYLNTTKYYKIKSLLQVYPTQNSYDPSDSLSLSLNGPSSNIENLIALYKSRTNIIKIINDLGLNINIDNIGFKNIEFKIHNNTDTEIESKIFLFKFYESFFELYDEDKTLLKKLRYDEKNSVGPFNIKVSNKFLKYDTFVEVKYKSPESLFSKYYNAINLTSSNPQNRTFGLSRADGLITVSFITDDIEQGKNILDYANKIFLEYGIEIETERARKALTFIDKNIISLENIYSKNKSKLQTFKENNRSINVDLEIQSIIETLGLIDKSINEVNIEITKAENIYTRDNPLYTSLVRKRDTLLDQKIEVNKKVQSLPKEQQEYFDLYRDVEVSQSLFEELQSRKLSYSILEASTLGNIRVVDPAFKEYLVSPSFLNVIAFSLFSLIIALFIAVIRGLYFISITNPAELADNQIYTPIVGVIPKVDDDNFNDNLQFNQAIESLVVNIQSLNKNIEKCTKITITSATASNGKSLLCSNIAMKLAQIGKKVLVIDNDQKRGRLHKVYDVKKISLSEFYSIDKDNINEYRVYENLAFIPNISKLKNSFQFLYNSSYASKLEEFEELFDYIIFDTAPILSVSDTPIIVSKSDINIVVARHGVTRINELKQIDDTLSQLNKSLDGVIYNSYEKPSSYYGYYGMYGNYAYQYYANKYLYDSYEYQNEEN